MLTHCFSRQKKDGFQKPSFLIFTVSFSTICRSIRVPPFSFCFSISMERGSRNLLSSASNPVKFFHESPYLYHTTGKHHPLLPFPRRLSALPLSSPAFFPMPKPLKISLLPVRQSMLPVCISFRNYGCHYMTHHLLQLTYKFRCRVFATLYFTEFFLPFACQLGTFQ